jgi:hypothetical protein
MNLDELKASCQILSGVIVIFVLSRTWVEYRQKSVYHFNGRFRFMLVDESCEVWRHFGRAGMACRRAGMA